MVDDPNATSCVAKCCASELILLDIRSCNETTCWTVRHYDVPPSTSSALLFSPHSAGAINKINDRRAGKPTHGTHKRRNIILQIIDQRYYHGPPHDHHSSSALARRSCVKESMIVSRSPVTVYIRTFPGITLRLINLSAGIYVQTFLL